MVHHSIKHQCFILLPNVWVVFKIYFAILHNIVARNNVQHCIRLNKQKEKKKVFTHLHYIRVVMLHIWVVCFEHMAAWTRCCDMQKVCGYIFEDCKRRTVRHKLNVHRIFNQILWLYDDIYIGICQIFSNYWNVSIQCKFLFSCQSEVCSDALVTLFSLSFSQHGCVLKS